MVYIKFSYTTNGKPKLKTYSSFSPSFLFLVPPSFPVVKVVLKKRCLYHWTKQLGTTSGDLGNGVTTDSSGNIYVTGWTGGGLDGNTNSLSNGGTSYIFLVKYDSSGTKQ